MFKPHKAIHLRGELDDSCESLSKIFCNLCPVIMSAKEKWYTLYSLQCLKAILGIQWFLFYLACTIKISVRNPEIFLLFNETKNVWGQ